MKQTVNVPVRRWSGNSQSQEDKAMERFTDIIIDNINNMKSSDWKQPWFSGQAQMGLPRNYEGRPYNGFNSVMLMLYSNSKNFGSPVFITSSKVESLNLKLEKGKKPVPRLDDDGNKLPFVHILKGEKAFPVIFHLPYAAKDKDTGERISVDNYTRLTQAEQSNYRLLVTNRVYNVFNVDQTNLKEARPEEYAKVTENEAFLESHQEEMNDFPAVDRMIKDNEWICPIHTDSTRGCYFSPSNNLVAVPPKEQFKDSDYFYTSLFHEMAHSTGHSSQLNRPAVASNEGMFSLSYAREELVAELTAALVGTRFGMTKHIKEDSCAYLKGWLQALKEEPDFLKTTLSDVKNAANLMNQYINDISNKIDKEQSDGSHLDTEEPISRADSPDDDTDKLDIQSENTLSGVDLDSNGAIDCVEVLSTNVPDRRQGANESHEKSEDISPHYSCHR